MSESATPNQFTDQNIIFNTAGKEILRLDENGMLYKDQRIEDGGEAHRAFMEVMRGFQAAQRSERFTRADVIDEVRDMIRSMYQGTEHLIEPTRIEQALRALKNAAPQVGRATYSPPITGEHSDKPAESASRCVAVTPDALAREYAKDCATLARYIVPTAPKFVRDIADGWIGDDDRDGERQLP